MNSLTTRTKPISGELLKLKEEIMAYAVDYGLDFHEVIYEVCDYDVINILAAGGGFPNRYPHWRFGMEYDKLSKSYAYGLQKIYEMVINTNPCYAYLLNVNDYVDQKIVMAHVYGHADFFKNNAWFRNTNKNMMDVMANHAAKIRRYMNVHGIDRVESFIDKVHSIENMLDMNILFKKDLISKEYDKPTDQFDENEGVSKALQSFMRSKKRNQVDDPEKVIEEIIPEFDDFSEVSKRDLMMYLLKNAPLEEWEADILGILREEAYYFLPQRLTKIMNEGWASYWHSTIMTKKAAKASEIIDFADHHAGVMAMSRQQLNPYKLGIELFRDIEYRWDTGKFGKEYNECEDLHKKENWNIETNLGKQKIFEVRRTHNDLTFIDEFFTPDFCERQQIFTYKYNPSTGRNEIDSKEFEQIKEMLLNQLTNFGTPVIEVETGNFNNRGELLLSHTTNGQELDTDFAELTLKNIQFMWKRPVNIKTISEDKEVIYSHNGKEFKKL